MKYSIFKRLNNQAAGSVPNDLRGCDWQLEYEKKFAELIVKECVTVLEQHQPFTKNPEAYTYAISLIEEHFGVEQ